MSYLNNINSPSDLKKLNIEEMKELAAEIRGAILKRDNIVGGHFGPNLGIVEATIALHFVFNSPQDKFVFDVSHQCYPHKMLTGRKEAFIDPLNNMHITGYSNQHESKHDFFTIGHTSTSISLACGMAKARDLKKEKYNIVAIIGDGSLSGGEALEGLSNAAVLGSNFIIVVNDNDISIAQTNGGLYKGLAELKRTKGNAQNNLFKAMGYEYLYVDDGNDIEKLITAFNNVKDINKPVVVHIHTLKGKGFRAAEEDKESYHWILPGGVDKKYDASANLETYGSITADYLLKKKETDNTVVAVSPATPGVCGFTPEFRAKMGKNYVDVDIAEQHSVGFVAGLATNGAKPVLALMSSFAQRAYDQFAQDLAINNAPATILIFWGGISGADVTHLTIFDISLIANIPNIVYLAPTNKEEYLAMLDWSVEQRQYTVVIRVPNGSVISDGETDVTDYGKLNKYKLTHSGDKIAIIGEGNFYYLAQQVQQKLKQELGIDATLINPVYLSGLDKQVLEELKQNHSVVIVLEDGCLAGGYAEKIATYYGNSDMKVLCYGADKEFTDRVPLDDLYRRYHLTAEQICDDVRQLKK